MRLLEMELRFQFNNRRASIEGVEVSTMVQYLDWKISFAQTHSMLSVELLGGDLDYLGELLIRNKRGTSTAAVKEEYTNALVYEVLAYLSKSVMPIVTNDRKLQALYLN